jgi:nitroreductase
VLKPFDVEQQKSVPFDRGMLSPGRLVQSPAAMMPLLDAICTRRTSRAYDATPVPYETFLWLVSHAMHAPTACNEQKWKVVYIDDPAIILDLYERGSASFIKNVKQCFFVCYNSQSDNLQWKDHLQSGAAFINTFMLLAHSIGIGTCWVGHLPNKSEVRRLLGIHRHYEPIALVTFGHYKSKVKLQPRKRDLNQVVFRNRFNSSGLNLNSDRGTLLRTVLRYLYYKIPAFCRRRLKPYTQRFEKKFYYETFD